MGSKLYNAWRWLVADRWLWCCVWVWLSLERANDKLYELYQEALDDDSNS